MWKKYEPTFEPARKPGSTIRDEQVFKEVVKYQDVLDNIATIKKEYKYGPILVGVSGMGHLSAQAHFVPERKDETDIFNYIRTTVVNTTGR